MNILALVNVTEFKIGWCGTEEKRTTRWKMERSTTHARKVVNISPESSFYQQLDLHDRAPPRADLCHICQRCFLTCSQLHLPQHQLLLKLSPFPRFSVRCAALPSTVRPHQLARPLGVQALGAPTALEFMKEKKKSRGDSAEIHSAWTRKPEKGRSAVETKFVCDLRDLLISFTRILLMKTWFRMQSKSPIIKKFFSAFVD